LPPSSSPVPPIGSALGVSLLVRRVARRSSPAVPARVATPELDARLDDALRELD
jgi:hypothetical protein